MIDLTAGTDDVGFVDPAGGRVDARWLVDAVVRGGGAGCDIRVLADGGERLARVLSEVADEQCCDVYVTAADTVVVERAGEPVAVDPDTGDPVDWLLIRPRGVPVDMPSWFDRSGGRVRPRKGLVSLPVSGGLGFASRASFLEMAVFVADLRVAVDTLTLIVATVHSGRFVIAWYDGTGERLGGDEFARLIGASLDGLSSDLQLAITWPTDAADAGTLDVELRRLAAALDRTVWVPEPGCAVATATVEPGLVVLAAVDAAGGPGKWRPYLPRPATGGRVGYDTDADGRLVSARRRESWDEAATPEAGGEGAAAGDLARLEPVHRGTLRAADIAFRTMRFDQPVEADALCRLSEAWAEYLPAYEQLVQGGAGGLAGGEGLDQVSRLRQRLFDVVEGAAPSPAAPTFAAPTVAVPTVAVPTVAAPPGAGDVPADVGQSRDWPSADAPAMIASQRGRGPHHLAWLPGVLLTNADRIELYAWTTIAPEHIPQHGLPVAEMYLLAHLDPQRLAARQRSGFLLRLSVPHGAAVDPSAYTHRLPARLRQRLQDSPDTYLVPLAWLSAVAVTACYQLDGHGGCSDAWPVDNAAFAVCFRGAEHGVPGLPNDVVRWPGRRPQASAYLVLPDDPSWIRARLAAYPGWLPLNRRRPNVSPGYRLLELAIARHGAIDLPDTLASLEAIPVAGSVLGSITGVDLMLPAQEFPNTEIVTVHAVGPRGRAVADHRLIGRPLTDALPVDSDHGNDHIRRAS